MGPGRETRGEKHSSWCFNPLLGGWVDLAFVSEREGGSGNSCRRRRRRHLEDVLAPVHGGGRQPLVEGELVHRGGMMAHVRVAHVVGMTGSEHTCNY